MSVHIRIPLTEEQKRILEDAKKGIHRDWSQFENDYDWDAYYSRMEQLYNPFEDVFTLICVRDNDIVFLFQTSYLYDLFVSVEDYMNQADSYRRAHHLKDIDKLTMADVKEYRERCHKEELKIREEIFGTKMLD